MAAYNNKFGGAIWTNHAISRLHERQLPQQMAWTAFQYPDKILPGKKRGTTEYQKRFGKYLVTIIGTKTDKGEWLILSCWMDPPVYGTKDYHKRQKYIKYKKASFLGKLWINIKYLFSR